MSLNSESNELSAAERALSLVALAKQAQCDGLDQLAHDYYRQSLNLYRELQDKSNILRLLIRLAYLSGWADFGDGLDMMTRRDKLGEEALPLARDVGDKTLLAEALCAFAAGKQTKQAKAMLEESLTLAQASGDKSVLALVLSDLGKFAALHQRDYERAMVLSQQALDIYQEIEDKANMARVLFSLAIYADGAEKQAYLEQALELQRALGAKKHMVEILMMLESHCDPADLDRREAYNLEALELCRQFGSTIWASGRLDRLAKIAQLRGDTARAEALEAESNFLYQRPPMDPAFEKALKSGSAEKAMKVFRRILKRGG